MSTKNTSAFPETTSELGLPPIMSLPNFRRWTGHGNSTTHELINAGLVETIRVGSRQYVVMDSYLRMISEQRSALRPAMSLRELKAQRKAATPTPPEGDRRRGPGRPRRVDRLSDGAV